MSIENIKGYVYMIRNKTTKKIYVGQTLSHSYDEKTKTWTDFGINGRILKHLQRVQQNVDYPLYNDIKKYGFQDFEIEFEHILEKNDIIKIDDLEKETINKYDSRNNGYNSSQNTNHMNISKRKIYEFYEKQIERSAEYYERRERRCQLTIPQKNRNSFFQDKQILSVKINPIKQGGMVYTARVIFDVKYEDKQELYRINFSNKDIQEAFNNSMSFIKEVYEGNIIDIHPFFQNIKTEDCKEKEVYAKARELEEMSKKNIEKINGKEFFHKEISKNVYCLSIYFDGGKKRIMFGGKHIDITNAYNSAQDFIKRLNVSENICCLSCPQQATAQ